MGLFTNPLGYAGYPPGVTADAQTVNSTVRAATAVEAAAGVLKNVYISPATQAADVAEDFASPPVLGFGSTTPRPVAATTLTSTGTTTIGSGAGVATKLGDATGTLGFFGGTGATKTAQMSITNNATAGGTTGTIASFAGTTYATDGPIIEADIYQLALSLSTLITTLKSYGLLT